MIALFALALGLTTFIVRLWAPVGWWLEPLHWQLGHFPQYIALFTIGIIAYRRNWFVGLSDAQGKVWLGIVLLLVVVLFPLIFVLGGGLEGDLTPFYGGFHWQSLVYAVWEQFLGIGMIVILLIWFRSKFTRQGKATKTMSAAAYAAYILHVPVIILVALALRGIKLDLGLKFVLILPIAVSLSFLIGYAVKRLPLARTIL
jgi:hypothetical protein